ncbi:MAG: hypothetical protein Q9191_003465 [Dirinaria sp. TL-2023a]
MLNPQPTHARVPSPPTQPGSKREETDKALPPQPPQFNRTVSEAPVINSSAHISGSPSKPSRPSISGLSSFQRPKKRVLWRGKACMIAFPVDDGWNMQKDTPLTSEDVAERLRQWEDRGYDTEGFRLSSEPSGSFKAIIDGQTTSIHPDPKEAEEERRNRNYRVSIPDRRDWETYVNRLKEEKLRALGVSSGSEDLSTRSTPAMPTMSRTASSQSSALTLSPTIASTLGANVVPSVHPLSHQPPLHSNNAPRTVSGAPQGPNQHMKPSTTHYPRYSTVMPIGSFPSSYPFSEQTSPLAGASTPLQPYSSQPPSRRVSPVVHPSLPNLGASLTPFSAASHTDNILAVSESSSELFARVQEQQARLQARSIPQQPVQQQPIFQPATQDQVNSHISDNDARTIKDSNQPKIASPIPRGHRLNLSETLQREAVDLRSSSEGSVEESSSPIHVVRRGTESESGSIESGSIDEKQQTGSSCDSPVETLPKHDGVIAQTGALEAAKSPEIPSEDVTKASESKLDATAPVFEIQPNNRSNPGVFAFQGNRQVFAELPNSKTNVPGNTRNIKDAPAVHTGLNVAAQPFVPASLQSRGGPSREFSFSSSGPTFRSDPLKFGHKEAGYYSSEKQMPPQPPDGDTNKIFVSIDFSEVIKPTKRSKAIPIIKPKVGEGESPEEADGQEDESGRITQPEGRQKRMRHHDDDGDEVPRFAIPPTPTQQMPAYRKPSGSISSLSSKASVSDEITLLKTATNQLKEMVDELPASETSELSDDRRSGGGGDVNPGPFAFDNVQEAAEFNFALPRESTQDKPLQEVAEELSHAAMEAIRDFPADTFPTDCSAEEVIGRVCESESVSSASSDESEDGPAHSATALELNDITDARDFAADALLNGVTYVEPSYDEIDAVMKQLNNEDSDLGVERNVSPRKSRSQAKDLESHIQEPSKSHKVLSPVRLRSDAPSPSPNRLHGPYQYLPPTESESADTAEREMVARNARFSPSYRPSKTDIHHLNSPSTRSVSDWDNAFSSSDEAKLRARIDFFDDRIDGVVGNIVRQHIGPLEKSLAGITDSLAVLSNRSASRRPRSGRSLSEEVEQSDADDEDDERTSQARSKSLFADRGYDKLKASIQEISAAQQQLAPAHQLAEVMGALQEIKASMQDAPKPVGDVKSPDIKTIVEEAIARQLRGRSGPITSSHQSATAEKSQLHIAGLESMLKIAESRAEDEMKARRATEDALADNQRLLRSALHEAAEQRESAEETERSLANYHEERHESLRRMAVLEGVQESLEKSAADLSEKNTALEGTLEEYRLSSTQWRQEIEEAKAENSGLKRTIDSLKAEIEESIKGRETIRNRFERLQEDMTLATNDIAREQSVWRAREEEYSAKIETLSAKLEAEARIRDRVEAEIDRLEVQEKEAIRTRLNMDQLQEAKVELERFVGQLKTENHEHQAAAARLGRECHDARENEKLEIQRSKTAMNAEIEAVRNQGKIVRADLESVIARLQSQVDTAAADAADVKARHELILEEASASRQKALGEATEARDKALQEHYGFHERTIADLRAQNERALGNALEDKARAESNLKERLALAEDKISHYTDRVVHLEEKLEIAKSAARSAVQAVQTQKASFTPPASRASLPLANGTNIPEKISPQALRESIMVLQEQLQQREARIEQLEMELSQVDTGAPEKLKSQDMEITWLRELLGVRLDDLQDVIGALSQPNYDRETVRDAAIRLRANLQMEQQERERPTARAQTFPSLTSISNLAGSPSALPLAAAAAWGNWRKAREAPSSSLSAIANGHIDQTPSRSSPSTQSLLSGLLTPPSTNMRQTPHTQAKGSPSRQVSTSKRPLEPYNTPLQGLKLQEEDQSLSHYSNPVTPPLMRQASYDQDAQSTEITAEARIAQIQAQAGAKDELFGPSIDALDSRAQ